MKRKTTKIQRPNFLLVGAAKCGTTSLYYYLNEHPQICMSSIKEPRFFSFAHTRSPENMWDRAITNFGEYQELFNGAKEGQVCGEASVHYLFLYRQTIENIKKFVPNWQELKIIIILRNPVDRAFSNFQMLKLRHAEPLLFEEALKVGEQRRKKGENVFFDYVNAGRYYRQVKAYLDTFPSTRVYLYEDLLTKPREVLKDLYLFLGIDNTFVPSSLKKHNISGEPYSWGIYNTFDWLKRFVAGDSLIKILIKPIMRVAIPSKESRTRLFYKTLGLLNAIQSKILKKVQVISPTKAYLQDIYRDDIVRLQMLLQKDLSSWLK